MSRGFTKFFKFFRRAQNDYRSKPDHHGAAVRGVRGAACPKKRDAQDAGQLGQMRDVRERPENGDLEIHRELEKQNGPDMMCPAHFVLCHEIANKSGGLEIAWEFM